MTFNTSLNLKRTTEDSSPRASKRLKSKARKEEAVTISSTLFGCSDIVSELFSFLDTRSLLQFSFVNKQFSSLLTYQYVVRAAMMSGGYTSETLGRMIGPIRDQMIWIPSPQRLLRVVSGKRCEKCYSTTRYVNPCIGLFLCNGCSVACTKQVFRGKLMNPYLDSARVQRCPRKGPRSPHRFLIKAPMKDVTGENIGPLVTLQDIEKMRNSNSTTMTPAEKVAAHIEECDARQSKATERKNAILAAVNENHGDAVARKKAILLAKLKGQKRFEEARKKRVDEILLQLKALVADQVSWKSNLDSRTWRSHGNQYFFTDAILQGILQPMLKAPSKITKKVLANIPGRIQSAIDKRGLMDQYIDRILDSVSDHDLAEQALRRDWVTSQFHYQFNRRPIREILNEPMKNPHALNEEELQKLCNQVKSILNRKADGQVVLRKLVQKLEGVPFKQDVEQWWWNNYELAYCFRRSHIQRVLKQPLLKPEDITEEKLDELAKEVTKELEKKQHAHQKVNLLVEPTRKYAAWTRRLNSWFWNSRDNKVIFHNMHARSILNAKFADLDNLTDEMIADLSKEVIAVFEKKYGSARTT